MELAGQQTVRREVMATTFAMTIAHPDARYARQAAEEALDEAERIEGRLSRYIEGSDVSRINRLGQGQATRVHPDVVDALRVAHRVRRLTDGAFDIAYGSVGRSAGGPRFRLDTSRGVVEVLADGLRLDLGGIGKGFALDRMARLLADWEIRSVFLSASRSTSLACDAPPGESGWPVMIGPGQNPLRLNLIQRAVSASGTTVRGGHIIDPRSGRPAGCRLRAWASAPTAATSDALSTAFMVLPETAIRRLCEEHRGIVAYLQTEQGGPLTVLETDQNAS